MMSILRATPILLIFGIIITKFCLAQENTEAKVCLGEASGNGKVGSSAEEYYNGLKAMYTNCTYVHNNVIIRAMGSLDARQYPLDFLKDIKEVSGHVHVKGPLPRGTTKLPFEDLLIIRGDMLSSYSDNHAEEFSLLIYNNDELTSLGLTSLKEISRGSVYIGYNRQNCYGETVDWSDIFHDTTSQRLNYTAGDGSKVCPPLHERCDANCSYCWGPGPEGCQERNKVTCAPQCDNRCFGPGAHECCKLGCLAGCSGPVDTDCWGCTDFYNEQKCVPSCPKAQIYNATSYEFDANPAAKVSFGKLCLKECPRGYLEFDEGCMLHTCPDGYTDINSKCVSCNGTCPSTCDWRHLHPDNDWITPSFLNQSINQNCTKIIGHVKLVAAAFENWDPANRDAWIGERALSLQDLQVLSTIEEISGSLIIETLDYVPSITSLDWLPNLRKVGGAEVASGGYSLVIEGEHLTRLGGFVDFKEVSSESVWIDGPKMCYPDDQTFIHWTKAGGHHIPQLGLPEFCADAKCHDQCAGSCVGPGDRDCLPCREDQNCTNAKCVNFEFEGICVPECSSDDGLFANATTGTCQRCHEQCDGACDGPRNTDCVACKNFKNGNRCIEKCPTPTYSDEKSQCHPCHDLCNMDFGCTGPLNTIGPGGCKACDLALLKDDGGTVSHCLNATAMGGNCDSGYLSITQMKKIREISSLSKLIIPQGLGKLCLKCGEKCAECETYPQTCTKCSDTTYEVVRGNAPSHFTQKECVDDCVNTKYFKDVDTRQCVECDDKCNGCFNRTDLDCLQCVGKRLDLNGTDGFQCVDDCPSYANYTWIHEKTAERLCMSYPKPKQGSTGSVLNKASQTGTIAGAVVGCIVVIVFAIIVITYGCRQRTKNIAKAKAYELQLVGPGTIEPITPSDANPDLSRLRLVKESELKRTVIIGSGAFGTVFKGFLIPESENVKVPVAIKVLIEGTSPSQNTELLDEARVMASVEHPCCIKIIAVCMTDPMMLITPLMPHGCLLSYVKDNSGSLGSKTLINWCAQIAKGMEHLQRCGIVHRDLAARNVLVQNNNQVKITDFGLAKLLDVGEDYYRAESGKVPVKWMALESIQHRIFNHQTDVWSYGVTIWELLTFGQKPYDGVKARDIAILLERGERLSQPSISTIDVYMIMIKCWMLDENSRPTFTELNQEFSKMARDPGRYLVIDGDQLKRTPTVKMNVQDWMFQDLDFTGSDTSYYPDKQLVAPDDYISPSVAGASYPGYVNENAIPPPFEKPGTIGSADNLHSPLRYTSSPTLRQSFPHDDKLTVDTEDYLQPVSVRGSHRAPSIDDDGYLQPKSINGYIDVLASDDQTNVPAIIRQSSISSDINEEEASREPLLGASAADNSIYLRSPDTTEPTHNPSKKKHPAVNGTNPVYMSNNNGSPVAKQPPSHDYNNIDYVNQPRQHPV